MSREPFRCPLCGFDFDPAANPACGQCPLHNGCSTVCCPNCGHSTIDPARSGLGRLASSLWGRRKGKRRRGGKLGRAHAPGRAAPGCAHCRSLAHTPVGCHARVIDLAGLPPNRRLQLQSLGLAPGRTVWVQQQEPVAIVLCGHTEVALEAELARGVLVELTD